MIHLGADTTAMFFSNADLWETAKASDEVLVLNPSGLRLQPLQASLSCCGFDECLA